jgi:hypothetical protein
MLGRLQHSKRQQYEVPKDSGALLLTHLSFIIYYTNPLAIPWVIVVATDKVRKLSGLKIDLARDKVWGGKKEGNESSHQ